MADHKRPLGRTFLAGVLGLVATTCVGDGAVAQTGQGIGSTCAPMELDATRLYRQLSLDLRGAPPTYDELQAVVREGRVTDAMINAMLRDERFLGQTRRWHADLLWPNLDGFTLQASPVRLTRGSANPEFALEVLDRRSEEATCPAVNNTTFAHLTAAACCTTSNPNHPGCCMARNRTFNADDPACVAKVQALGAIFVAYNGLGDAPLRGGGGSTGCDDSLEYPPPRVARDDRRWLHDASGRPYYLSPRSGRIRYYYDQDEVPLPYDDWTHCPNYCRAAMGTGAGGSYLPGDYVQKVRMEGGRMVQGDGPGASCPEGTTEIVNPCDNLLYRQNQGTDYRLRVRREGYRVMRTYWSTRHPVKVCAYEAQVRTNSAYNGLACAPIARMDPSCGCGPDGNYCMPSQGYQSRASSLTEFRIRGALNEEPLQIVASVIGRDEDYYNVYTTRRSFITGPLSFMHREQAGRLIGLQVSPPAQGAALPNVPYEDAAWHEYVRGPEHSGVLTTPAYLGRFPTWRSRITQFRTFLMCRPFEPPAGGLPEPDSTCTREPNLAQRCGCQHCHAAIEPLGAYWGRWAERSAVYLDPASFPSFDPNCATCAITGALCSARCRANYVTSTLDADGSRYAGTLFGYLYRSSEELPRIDQGPAALVANALSNGEMQSCTVRTTWRRLVGRAMSEEETTQVLPILLQQFQSSGHNYRSLVRAIVSAPAYRRID